MAVRFEPVPQALRAIGRDVALWFERLANKRTAAQADSTAATVAELKADHNALLAKLRAAGMMDE